MAEKRIAEIQKIREEIYTNKDNMEQIQMAQLINRMKEGNVTQEVVAYCRGRYCLLSVEAVELLRSHGFKAVRLEESVQEWYSYNNEH